MQYEVGLYVSGILRLIWSMPTWEFFFYDLLFMELFIPFLYFFGGLSMWIADWSVLPDTFMEGNLLHLFILFILYYISSYADFCFFITVYCLTLCIAWYWLTQIFYRQTSAFCFYIILYYVLPDAAWSWLSLTDFNFIGHSALRTMWLSATVLA